MENKENLDEKEEKFELKTKTGSVWGSKEDELVLKEKIIDDKTSELDNKRNTFINAILSLTIIILVIILLIYLDKKGIWFL